MPPTNIDPAAPQVPPQAPPQSYPTYAEQPKRKAWPLVIIMLVFLLVVAGVSYAYVEKIGFFGRPPYDTEHLAQSIVNGLAQITTSEYTLRYGVKSEPREADAKPFSAAINGNTEREAAYKRDQDTLRIVSSVLEAIRNYYYKNKKYPVSLAAVSKAGAIAGAIYKKTATGYEYSVTFESPEAVQALGRYASLASKGKTLVLTEKSSYLYLPEKMPQAGLASILDMQSAVNYIPADFMLDIGLSGAILNNTESIDNKVGFTGTAVMGDMNVTVDAEFRKIGKDMYVIINKMPTLFASISKIKGKWIKITESDVGTYGSAYLRSDGEELEEKKAESVKAMRMFLDIADKNKTLTLSAEPRREKVNGQTLYRYDLKLNKDTIVQFYTELTDAYKKEFGDDFAIKFDEATAEYLKGQHFAQVFDYLSSNSSLTVWADGEGRPIQTQSTLRVVPDSTKNKDNQVRMQTTFTFDKVNTNIKVDSPAEFMTVEDATIMLSGQTKEEYRLSKQMSNISSLRNALSTYRQLTGSYPATLDDLTKTYGELRKATSTNSGTQTSFSYRKDDEKLMRSVPVDLYTDNTFGYSGGKDYLLGYRIELPKYTPGSPLPRAITMSYPTRKYKMIVVNGKNTADSKTESKEADAQSQEDTDGDGLTNVVEVYLGTQVTNKDSDKDSYSDSEELMSGSNPLGPGRLEGSSYY
jgi:hypothetical protein